MSDQDSTEKSIGRMLLDLYRPRFELQFAYHPKGKEIVELLCQGGNPAELVELWFAEAAAYYFEAMRPPIRGAMRQGGGNVKFAIVKGSD